MLKLNRILYGLKQAAATWYKTISCVFVEMDFSSCAADSCIFVKETNDSWIYAALYVEDLLIGAESTGAMDDVATQLSSRFQLKIWGGGRSLRSWHRSQVPARRSTSQYQSRIVYIKIGREVQSS